MSATSIAFRPRGSPPPTPPPAAPRVAGSTGATTTLQVDGMDCASCAQKVTQALTAVAGVDATQVDLASGRASVHWKINAIPATDLLIGAVAKAGYRGRLATVIAAGTPTTLRVEGMDCASCARKVTDALSQVAGVDSVNVELAAGRAEVRWKGNAPADPTALIAAVTQAGYRGSLVAVDAPAASDSPVQAWRAAVWLGGPVTLILVLGEWVFGLGMNRTFQWIAFLLALPVQVWIGGRFYRGAWRQARAGQSNMDTLVSLGSTAAFGFSVWGLLSGYPGHLYFMEAAAILTLVSVGHWLEARMSTKAGAALKSLLDLAPATARQLKPDNSIEIEVPVSALVPGDRIVLKPGDRVPVDAEVVSGDSTVDEAMLTGEAWPVEKTAGSKLFAGTANQTGRLIARVNATGDTTALAHIIAAVQRAQSSRANIQRLADRVSSVFVPVVIAIAVVTALGWFLGYDSALALHGRLAGALWHTQVPASPLAAAFAMFAAVLIVACPCAMGLATPTALMAGVNAAARRGILIRDAQALEKSGRVTLLVFDKTGTLTQGKPTVVAQMDFRPAGHPGADLTRLAAALAGPSQHPLSLAVAVQRTAEGATGNNGPPAGSDLRLIQWREIRGSGVEAQGASRGTVDPTGDSPQFRLGSVNWLRGLGVKLGPAESFLQEQAKAGATVLLLAQDQELLGAFALRDALKPNAREIVETLRQRGLKVRLLTGDQRATATAVAEELGLPPDAVSAEVRPEQKAEIIRGLQQEGERVAFVGDGLNDGPALAQADLGIAVTRATDVAREAADILLLKSDLAAIPEALDLAQATLRVIRQNLFWAFFYNAAAIPLAATGLLSPVICAAAMGFSDVIVIGNALRLRKRGSK